MRVKMKITGQIWMWQLSTQFAHFEQTYPIPLLVTDALLWKEPQYEHTPY